MSSETVKYRYRIYPDAGQRRALAQTFGCARVVFNRVIALREAARAVGEPFPSYATVAAQLKGWRADPEAPWLAEPSQTALEQAIRQADTAYKNFFASIRGARKGRRVGHPKFRSRKDNRQSVTLTRSAVFRLRKVGRDRALLKLPKMGEVRVAYSRELPSDPTSVTIIQEADGRYYASFTVTRETTPLPAENTVAGADLGLTDLATIVSSDGGRVKVPGPKLTKTWERKLARAQRELARRQKGGTNREKSRRKVAQIHRRIRETRADHHHKLAHQLVHDNQVIVLETLGITGLTRGRMSKAVHDASWGAFIRLVEEKALSHGRTIIRADRAFPSSQICAACGHRDGPKPLHVRTWSCGNCGTRLDRDYNAATNLMMLAAGHAESLNALGEASSGHQLTLVTKLASVNWEPPVTAAHAA